MPERLHADKVMQQGARSSVVNGPFTGTKERRSFKPKVASSILVGRIGGLGQGKRLAELSSPVLNTGYCLNQALNQENLNEGQSVANANRGFLAEERGLLLLDPM